MAAYWKADSKQQADRETAVIVASLSPCGIYHLAGKCEAKVHEVEEEFEKCES